MTHQGITRPTIFKDFLISAGIGGGILTAMAAFNGYNQSAAMIVGAAGGMAAHALVGSLAFFTVLGKVAKNLETAPDGTSDWDKAVWKTFKTPENFGGAINDMSHESIKISAALCAGGALYQFA